MLKHNSKKKRAFYVVQFIELPFEGIDDYVCVPSTWLIVRRAMDQKAVVAYPKDEDPFDTRDRVKSEERCNDEWRFYMAVVKYESDTYKDAEYWIATRNDNGPLVEEESKITDTLPRVTVNKKLRSANQSHSSKSNDNPRKPLPKISIKRPGLSEPKKQIDRKRLKLSEDAQSSNAVVDDSNAEPGHSKTQQSDIIQNNQSMECAQTETLTIASNSTPIAVVNDNENVQPISTTEQELPSSHILSQCVEQPESVQKPKYSVASSVEMTNDNQEVRTVDFVSDEPTSHHIPNSLKMGAQLYSHISEARQLVPIQKPVEKRIRLMNIARNLANDSQKPSNLIHQTGSLPSRSVEQPSVLTHNRSEYGQRLLQMHIGNSKDQTAPHRTNVISSRGVQHIPKMNFKVQDVPNPRTIRMSIPSIGQNLTRTSNPLHQTFKLAKQRQAQPNHQDAQQQPQKPKIRIGISINPKNNRQIPTLQGITKKTPQPIITKVLNSIRQALSTTHNDDLLNKQQLQISQSGSLHPESHLKAMDNACQTDDCMGEETPSPYHAVTSDSDAVTDHEVISDYEMFGDELPVEITNNSDDSGIAFRSNSAERPTAAQNLTSTNHQTHPRVVLEQQMLDNFASLLSQMGSTLRYTCDMYNNLRKSIHETAQTYRCLLDTVDRFNTVQNSASNAFLSSNLTPQVPPATQERYIEATATANLSSKDRHIHDLANNAPKNKHNNLWRFVLPPEYDPQDTRWTLKYQTNMPGLVELMPRSGIYVGYGELKYCQQLSKDCKSLARRLLPEVFNREALSVCLSMSEKSQGPNNAGSNVRPELDEHATSVLLNFVLEHGLQCGWNTDLQPIISTLNSKIQKIRSKYGVMVKC